MDADHESDILYEQFLDAKYARDKKDILQKIKVKGYLTDKMIDDFAVTTDIIVPQGDLELRYYDLMRCLDSMAKFEAAGLR